MTVSRTLFIRRDTSPWPGRADVAHVRLIRDSDKTSAYLGEVSGYEEPANCVHVGHLTTETPREWVASMGYSFPADPLYPE